MTSSSTRPRAIVVGAGIGGLAAAAALHASGWEVTVLERATSLDPIGAGLALAPNGLRALDALGIGDDLRAHAADQEIGIRRPSGRWLVPASSGAMVSERYGDPIVLLPRARVVEALAGLLPAGALRLSTEVESVSAEGRVVTSGGALVADLVVAADGIWSVSRTALVPGHRAPTYTGITAWRFITPVLGRAPAMAETWGRGRVFGVMPLADGRCYCFGAARAREGAAGGDEVAELQRLFGGWHRPIPELIGSVSSAQVLRNDVFALPRPLPAMHVGRVALLGDAAHAMTPSLGQGACQALEDAITLARLVSADEPAGMPAALARYSSLRVARTAMVMKRSRQATAVSTLANPAVVTVRDALMAVVGRTAAGAMQGGMASIFDWRPPPR